MGKTRPPPYNSQSLQNYIFAELKDMTLKTWSFYSFCGALSSSVIEFLLPALYQNLKLRCTVIKNN